MSNTKITCLACGVFRKELEALVSQGLLDFDIRFLESMLHMNPAKLERVMDKAMPAGSTDNFLLLYGDCQPGMHEMQTRENATKVAGMNCCEIFLGKEVYRRLQKEKAFIFLPEWAERWQEVFTHELGFNKPENAQAFLKEHLDKLVYIDTGVVPIPNKTLQDIAIFFDMPFEILHISLDILRQEIMLALQKFIKGGAQ